MNLDPQLTSILCRLHFWLEFDPTAWKEQSDVSLLRTIGSFLLVTMELLWIPKIVSGEAAIGAIRTLVRDRISTSVNVFMQRKVPFWRSVLLWQEKEHFTLLFFHVFGALKLSSNAWINKKIQRLVYCEDYRENVGRAMLEEAGVEITKLEFYFYDKI